ncbi:KptA family-domain-containing protein [Mycena galopus ATCC 62051]|nr:KptA family-domain-containing protein [Mycena galopus ATCC 62051]
MIWLTRELAQLLRHDAKSAGLTIHADGYVEVDALVRLNHRSLRGLDFAKLDTIVSNDPKRRFRLILGRGGRWLIRANQGHSIPGVMGGLRRIFFAWQIRMAVHGTSMKAWEAICTQGLARMGRSHIHLAQDFMSKGIIDLFLGCEVLISIDFIRAVEAGNKFYVSSNGVVLTPGNEMGFLEPRFFSRVESNGAGPLIPEWERPVNDEKGEDEVTHQAPSASVLNVGSGTVSASSVPEVTEPEVHFRRISDGIESH